MRPSTILIKMNEENSYESDISEGWSLIDINLNEESMDTSATQSLVDNEKRLQPDSVNSSLNEAKSFQSINSSKNKLNNEVEGTSSSLSNSSSDDSPPNEEILSNCNEILTEGKDSASELVHDSCDAESIEILDVDGNYRDSDIDNLDVTVFDIPDLDGSDHSSNKQSWSEGHNTHHFSGLKRKRRKLSRDSESSADNFVSEIASSDGRYSCKTKVVKIQTFKQHVYRHYRNNFANTVLNLTMSVIFAGVVCIAIGHFLGVQDGEGTAGELYDTFKKIQRENIVLQSRLSQLNRALFTREVASKWESNLNKSSCGKNIESEKSENDQTSQAKIQPEFNCAEWLRVHKLVQKGCINNEMVDVTKISNYIEDLLTFLRSTKKEGGNKIEDLEDTKAKISKLLQMMAIKLSSSQENFDNAFSRLVKLKFNKKVGELFPDLPEGYGRHSQECPGFNSRVEKNLNSMQWTPVGKTTQSTILTDNPKQNPETTVSLYIFPQSEEYYLGEGGNFAKKENTSSSVVDEKGIDGGGMNEKETPRSKEVILEIEEETPKQDRKPDEAENKTEMKQKGKKVGAGKTKRELTERDSTGKQSNNHKPKTEKGKTDEKKSKRKFDNSEPKEKYSKKWKRGSGEDRGNMKKRSKTKKQVVRQEIKVGKRKRKTLNFPKGFSRKEGKREVWLEPEQFHGKEEEFTAEDRILNGKFSNLTGDWFFRLSKGRNEFRQQEILSDWQFERAKARMGWRNGDKLNTNWQFLRALAREDGRMEKLSNNRK